MKKQKITILIFLWLTANTLADGTLESVSGGIEIKPADGPIKFLSNGDTDNYLKFETGLLTSNRPAVKVVGGNAMEFYAEDQAWLALGLRADSNDGAAAFIKRNSSGGNGEFEIKNYDSGAIQLIGDGGGSIDILPSDDYDDYFRFETISNIPYLKSVGGSGQLRVSGDYNPYQAIRIMDADGRYLELTKQNDGVGYIYNNEGGLHLYANGDTNDYLEFRTDSNRLIYDSVGTSHNFMGDSNAVINIVPENDGNNADLLFWNYDGYTKNAGFRFDNNDGKGGLNYIASIGKRRLVPYSDSSYDLGSESYRWKNGFFNELEVSGLEDAGSVVCVKTDGKLGTCSNPQDANGKCNCI